MADGFEGTLETVCGGRVDSVIVLLRVNAIEGVMVPIGPHKVGKDSCGTLWHSIGPYGAFRPLNTTLLHVRV